jgi:hypothetical protein
MIRLSTPVSNRHLSPRKGGLLHFFNSKIKYESLRGKRIIMSVKDGPSKKSKKVKPIEETLASIEKLSLEQMDRMFDD